MQLTKPEVEALVEWAEESYREGGCTAWGLKFSAALHVAQTIRNTERYQASTMTAIVIRYLCQHPPCLNAGRYDSGYCGIHDILYNKGSGKLK